MSVFFQVNYGGIHGACPHKHPNFGEAVACLTASERKYNAVVRGQASIADFLVDAQVFAVEDGEERRATPQEMGYTQEEWDEIQTTG
jgi:hypothetical protein